MFQNSSMDASENNFKYLMPYAILPPNMRIESVDHLAGEIKEIFNNPERYLEDDVYHLPIEPNISPPINKTHKYFNAMHQYLTNERVTHFSAKDNVFKKEKCRIL